jgi:DNA-binding SARP family transcriptional activator
VDTRHPFPDQTIRQLRLLDGFDLEIGGRPVTLAVGAQRLLAYLALHGGSPRLTVACALWAEVAQERACASLRTTMWRVNKAVPGLVTVDQWRLTLAKSLSVDVIEFVKQVNARFRHALAVQWEPPTLRAHELLPGWTEDWVVFERERLRQLSLHALEHAAAEHCQAGQYAVALDLALLAVRGDPLRESARRLVMEVHLAEGNVGEAVREYRRFHRLLVDRLGIDPSPALGRLIPRSHDEDDRPRPGLGQPGFRARLARAG